MLRVAWSTLEPACVTQRAEGRPFSASPHSLVVLKSFDSLKGGTLVVCVCVPVERASVRLKTLIP